jgi:hypothetical protein
MNVNPLRLTILFGVLANMTACSPEPTPQASIKLESYSSFSDANIRRCLENRSTSPDLVLMRFRLKDSEWKIEAVPGPMLVYSARLEIGSESEEAGIKWILFHRHKGLTFTTAAAYNNSCRDYDLSTLNEMRRRRDVIPSEKWLESLEMELASSTNLKGLTDVNHAMGHALLEKGFNVRLSGMVSNAIPYIGSD